MELSEAGYPKSVVQYKFAFDSVMQSFLQCYAFPPADNQYVNRYQKSRLLNLQG